MMRPTMLGKWIVVSARLLSLCVVIMTSQTHVAYAQADTIHSSMDYYLRFAHKLGTAKLDFPGPGGGFTFIHLPTKEDNGLGDTIVNDHTYLLDLNVSTDGLYLAPDTMLSFSHQTAFEFELPGGHIIHAQLTPGHSHEALLKIDTTFNGTIGYGLIKEYITAFDFKRNQLTFYSLLANDSIADDDTNVIQLPIIDDEMISYCHCKQPTIWLDVHAPPLPDGHVNLAFQDPKSEIYRPSLDSGTRMLTDKKHLADSLAGGKHPVGIVLDQFITHDLSGRAVNLISHGSHRWVDPRPDIYHDFIYPVMGSLGTDVLRTFRGIIIDPSRGKLIFVK